MNSEKIDKEGTVVRDIKPMQKWKRRRAKDVEKHASNVETRESGTSCFLDSFGLG